VFLAARLDLDIMFWHVYLEVPIVLLSLCCWITKLSQVYSQYSSDVELEPSIVFFMLQLLLSTMWIICATLSMQWLVLITTCNGFLCQISIIFFMYKIRQREHAKILAGYMHVTSPSAAGLHHDTKQKMFVLHPMTASKPALFTKAMHGMDH